MLRVPEILVSVLAVLPAGLLVGCGQKGPLFLPAGEAAANRATLPETLAPSTFVAPMPQGAASAPTSTGTASPVRTP